METDPKSQSAAVLGSGKLSHLGNLLFNLVRGLTPGEVDINVLGRDINGSIRRAAKVEWRIRSLQPGKKDLSATDPQLFAFKVDLAAGCQYRPPDSQELIGNGVTPVVFNEQSISDEFYRITARHHINKDSPFAQPVKSCRHSRCQSRRHQPRPYSDQKPHPPGVRREKRGRHPGVFTRSAGWQEGSIKTKVVDRAGNLAQIAQIEYSATVIRAQITPISVGRNEPKDPHGV
jgi:hypothetical protein